MRPAHGLSRGALRALLPITLGHLASVTVALGGVVGGASAGHGALAIATLAGLLALVGWGPGAWRRGGLALGSFSLCMVHGAGLSFLPALVPAFVPVLLPLCGGGPPALGAVVGPALWLALAALAAHLAVHTAAMLGVSGLAAMLAGRVFAHRQCTEPALR